MQRINIPTNNPFGDEFGYSRAVRVGNHIHVAGTVAQPPHDQGDAYTQAKGALGIIEKALGEAGASLSDVVRTVVYITDTAHAEGITRAHAETFGEFGPGNGSYYLATSFEEIFLQPSGDLGLTGMMYESPFVKGALNRLFIHPRLSKRKEYKNAANLFTEEAYTRAHRESITRLMNSQYQQLWLPCGQ